MADSETPESAKIDKTAKMLNLAMEAIRREFVDSAVFLFENRERAKKAPDWAYQTLEPVETPKGPSTPADVHAPASLRPPTRTTPTIIPETTTTSPPTTSGGGNIPVATPIVTPNVSPALPPLPPPPKGTAIGGGFQPKQPSDQSPVSAFDRPQAVIIVGPKPLLVRLDQAFQHPATTPRAEREQAGTAGPGGTAKAIATRFLAVLGPLYALNTVLGQANSGLGVFGKAVNVLGATLAPVVLPFFAILATGILTLSDYIQSELMPALGRFYDWALKFGMPVAQKKVEDVSTAIDTANAISKGNVGELPKLEKLPGMVDSLARNLDPTGASQRFIDNVGGAKDLFDKAGRHLFGGKDWEGAVQERRGTSDPLKVKPEDEKKKFNFGESMNANMRDVIRSLAMSLGPKASYSSLGEVGKQAQLAALNQDPIEAKLLRQMIKTLEEWQMAWERKQAQNIKEQINRREDKR